MRSEWTRQHVTSHGTPGRPLTRQPLPAGRSPLVRPSGPVTGPVARRVPRSEYTGGARGSHRARPLPATR